VHQNCWPGGLASLPGEFELLDFASGFGMLNRHLKNFLPHARITATDIHPQAVEFNKEILKHSAFLSSSNPADFSLPSPSTRFHVILAISFFSHIPIATLGSWMQRLSSLLHESGILVFTTHGLTSGIAKDGKYLSRGITYSFSPFSEQKDLPAEDYGTTYIHPNAVMEIISPINSIHLVEFRGGFFWGGNQDLYVFCKKSPSEAIKTWGQKISNED
jgi:cyclopropane fatty-acyl-phospholipid synthase-like methyltransferase